PFSAAVFQEAEAYLGGSTGSSFLVVAADLLRKKALHMTIKDERYGQLQSGLLATIDLLNTLQDFLRKVDGPATTQFETVKKALNAHRTRWLDGTPAGQPLTLLQQARYDHFIRHVLREETESILDFIYHLDVYIAVSSVARARNFSYAQALPK